MMTAERELTPRALICIGPESCDSNFVGVSDLVRSSITSNQIQLALVASISEAEIQGTKIHPELTKNKYTKRSYSPKPSLASPRWEPQLLSGGWTRC